MLYYYTSSTARLLATVALCASPAFAETPRVVTDIPPVHSLVSQVMEGVGTPDLVIPATASPHSYSMRPSQAASLQNADLVFWIGPELTPWLELPLENLANSAKKIALIDNEATRTLEFRELEDMTEADAHDDHADHAKHDDHGDHDDHAEHDGHEDHSDHADHDEHDHEGVDPHAWLDPQNATAWIGVIAEALAAQDPDNADTYKANAKAASAEILQNAAKIAQDLKPLHDENFVVFHDAYQYFENRFDLSAVGSIVLNDASQPSPARLSQIQTVLKEHEVACVFTEAQFSEKLVNTVVEGTDVKRAELDPLGASFEPGASLYLNVINGLADKIKTCLTR